ncbi:hypothetical protein, partial [Mesorhizobium sp. M2D.F.Ca.ET.148.01.1.1]|uniref:hypothetical protein n=1 Tax=Mesorhizobium sp. M2D.F.Ca.ET.148.01.1.1 TaxID=2496665 RepID=UPI001AEEA7D2
GVGVLICHVPLHRGRIDLAQSETSSSLRCCIEYDLVDEAVSSSRLTVYEEEKWGYQEQALSVIGPCTTTIATMAS